MTTESPTSNAAKPKRVRAPRPVGTAMATRPQERAKMPTEHLDHAGVFHNELNVRLSGFDAAIAAFRQELAGEQIAFDEAIAALTRDHDSSVAQLGRRISDMERGRRMALAAIAAATETAA